MTASLDSRGGRAVGFLLLALLVFAAGIAFGAQPPAPGLGVPPSQDELAENCEAFLGERAVVDGPVIETDPLTIRAETRYGGTIDLRLVTGPVDVRPGDHLNVHGVVRPDGRIDVRQTVNTPGEGYLFTRLVSLLAGLLVLGHAFRHWSIDLRHLRASPRNVGDDA